MTQLMLLMLLNAEVIQGPFPIAEHEPGHHQVCVRAAMTPDGRFAVTWVDSLQGALELELLVCFFSREGNPLTDAYQVAKIADTNWIYWPCLDMDTAGNAVLVWVDNKTQSDEWLSNIRFQAFAPDGTPAGNAQTLLSNLWLKNNKRSTDVGLDNNGDFVVTWSEVEYQGPYKQMVWVQRFDANGSPQGPAFLAHDDPGEKRIDFLYPQVALNDAGDLVVTWVDYKKANENYPRFQVFDAQDVSILPWEPLGHRLDDGAERYDACRPKPYWLDDDRFVAFWVDATDALPHLVGRVFSGRGLTRHPITTLLRDSLAMTFIATEGAYSVALSSDERFAYTHTRSHYYADDPYPWEHSWDHQAGILGKLQDNEPLRMTTLFEYTPPWGEDTVYNWINNRPHIPIPAVAVCNNRIVWVYSRLNTDTIFEAYYLISDWDMGEGVTEQPVVSEPTNWEVASAVGPEIVLRYSDCPEGFHANVYDAAGRKVDELHSSQTSGTITWGEGYGPGVYFIREITSSQTVRKVVLIK